MSTVVKFPTTHPSLDLASRLAHHLAGYVARAGRAVRSGFSAWRSRSDVARLARLDERMLADMGLTRADIRDAIARPLWSDPTAMLAERRRERQVHDYRAIFSQLTRERNTVPPARSDVRRCPPTEPARLAR